MALLAWAMVLASSEIIPLFITSCPWVVRRSFSVRSATALPVRVEMLPTYWFLALAKCLPGQQRCVHDTVDTPGPVLVFGRRGRQGERECSAATQPLDPTMLLPPEKKPSEKRRPPREWGVPFRHLGLLPLCHQPGRSRASRQCGCPGCTG